MLIFAGGAAALVHRGGAAAGAARRGTACTKDRAKCGSLPAPQRGKQDLKELFHAKTS